MKPQSPNLMVLKQRFFICDKTIKASVYGPFVVGLHQDFSIENLLKLGINYLNVNFDARLDIEQRFSQQFNSNWMKHLKDSNLSETDTPELIRTLYAVHFTAAKSKLEVPLEVLHTELQQKFVSASARDLINLLMKYPSFYRDLELAVDKEVREVYRFQYELVIPGTRLKLSEPQGIFVPSFIERSPQKKHVALRSLTEVLPIWPTKLVVVQRSIIKEPVRSLLFVVKEK